MLFLKGRLTLINPLSHYPEQESILIILCLITKHPDPLQCVPLSVVENQMLVLWHLMPISLMTQHLLM